MGLNTLGRGCGRENTTNFPINGRHGGGVVDQRHILKPGPPGMCGPPVPQQVPFRAPQNFRGPPRPVFGRFPQNNLKKTIYPKKSAFALEIDLRKPWVNEKIKNEETKKQELFQIWKKTKNDEDWNNYKAQKFTVKSMYDKAKAEYASSHPDQAILQENVLIARKYYCETCDKSFRTDDDLFFHESEHETCGRDGCEFTAHPKIISKHIKMQHLSGLYKRIGKLYSEEDIAKWIEERKRRYPTRKVVEEKKLLEEEKLRRGERIKDDDSKFNKKFQNRNKGKTKKNIENKTQKKNRNRRTRKKKSTSVVKKCIEEEISAIRKGVPAFSGIRNDDEAEVPEKGGLDISDEEWENENKLPTPVKPLLNNSLGLLAAVYDSEEEEQTEEAKVDNVSADEGSGPEEVATIISKNDYAEQNSVKEKTSRKRKLLDKKNEQQRKKQLTVVHNVEKRDLTLLEKLLKNEIRHERNVILQCVHYVIKNNFLQT